MQYSQHATEHRSRHAARTFRPGLAPTLVVLALLPVLIALGCWQLSRASEKRTLLAAAEAQRQLDPISAAELARLPPRSYVRVRLQGRLDAEHSVLLDNRTRNGQAGVEVLQPFFDRVGHQWLLVNRGWVAWPDRRVPPQIETPIHDLLLDAWTYVPPTAGPTAPVAGWPRLVTQVDAPFLWDQLGREGSPLEIRLEPGDAAFDTDWPIVAMPPERHIGYAVQWFALAIALSGLYLYLGIRRARETHDHDRHDPA
ncbi:SURF1 family protein [Pseudomonas sp. ZM23]|uniref:SURF1-like protein n=1 Tax=Pseudomonas triclosanedens TaxID=2961893 RepID=A0ABY6ZYD6_9PSED|nr:SURF1 family protein [Pseudomonas triclosanedens]MCP8462580.1 SURF1 family protein [Pseudomonas triclosanedens]MCP8468218.1 SURF1 family protein [Pseudomonas triclosanedens]MCP8474977.1 SURF1 family protein [Pseudomonas triclosanedens]WAI49771.1 SURF1 family protein [Pseudomonas triclosanedens]